MVFGKLFGRKGDDAGAAPPEERGPLALAVGHAVEVDTLGVHGDLADGDPAMGPPEGGGFVVAAYGRADLGDGTVLHRYYDDAHRILQVMAPEGGALEDVQDVSLYVPWDSVVPAGPSDWARWTGPEGAMGAPRYDADGVVYERFWGDGEDRTPPVEFVEEVYDGETVRSIHQRCMLYHRPVGAGREMLLLSVERDLSASSEGSSVEFMVGYGLGPGDVRRI